MRAVPEGGPPTFQCPPSPQKKRPHPAMWRQWVFLFFTAKYLEKEIINKNWNQSKGSIPRTALVKPASVFSLLLTDTTSSSSLQRRSKTLRGSHKLTNEIIREFHVIFILISGSCSLFDESLL